MRVRMMRALTWMSLEVVSGVRIVQCHAIMNVVIGVRVMEFHEIIDVVIGVRVVLLSPSHRQFWVFPLSEFSTSCPNSHLVIKL